MGNFADVFALVHGEDGLEVVLLNDFVDVPLACF